MSYCSNCADLPFFVPYFMMPGFYYREDLKPLTQAISTENFEHQQVQRSIQKQALGVTQDDFFDIFPTITSKKIEEGMKFLSGFNVQGIALSQEATLAKLTIDLKQIVDYQCLFRFEKPFLFY